MGDRVREGVGAVRRYKRKGVGLGVGEGRRGARESGSREKVRVNRGRERVEWEVGDKRFGGRNGVWKVWQRKG